jgi:DNA polymerase III delta prime subunit
VGETPVLDRIEGQPRAVALLDRARRSGRIAHAWAFVGPKGSGRTTAAVALAAAVLCDDGGCGACRACRTVSAGAHPDVHVIAPTPPAGNPRGARAIRIDAIRELERQASLRPVMGRVKVFVLDDADRMTDTAPEAFLKTLEEPPANTVIVLVLGSARAVPATVLSRCRIVRFEARPAPVPAAWGRALELIGTARAEGLAEVFQRFDRSRPDRDEAEALLDAWWLWCRDLALARAAVPDDGLFTDPAGAPAARREAESWTLDDVCGTIELIRETREALAVNVAPRLGLELVLGRLALRLP